MTPAEQETIETHIDDTADMLETRLEESGMTEPVLTERWQRLYKKVIANSIIRYLRNPDGLLSEEIAIDDFREVRRRDSVNSTGRIYLATEDLLSLLPDTIRRKQRGAFTIRLGNT